MKAGRTTRTPSDSGPLILYDGVCGLCHGTVRFVLRRDRGGRFRFAPLQGETAGALLGRHGLARELDSLIYVEGFGGPAERVYMRSDGVLRILVQLGGAWRCVNALRILPRPLRDAVYDLVARYRYRWFGRLDSCPLPSPEARARFLP